MLTYLAANAGIEPSDLSIDMELERLPLRWINSDLSVAMNWHLTPLDGSVLVSHGGLSDTAVSHAVYDPVSKIGVFISANYSRDSNNVAVYPPTWEGTQALVRVASGQMNDPSPSREREKARSMSPLWFSDLFD